MVVAAGAEAVNLSLRVRLNRGLPHAPPPSLSPLALHPGVLRPSPPHTLETAGTGHRVSAKYLFGVPAILVSLEQRGNTMPWLVVVAVLWLPAMKCGVVVVVWMGGAWMRRGRES